MTDIAAQLVLNGISLGASYALVALGFVLILNAVGAVNFAHGDAVMAGGYIAIATVAFLPEWGRGFGLAVLPLVLLAAAMLGLILAWVGYFPIRRRPPVAVFVSTIAIGVILQSGADVLFGAAPRAGPSLVGGGNLSLGGIRLDHQQIAVIAVASLACAGVWALLSRTRVGRQLRAVAQDPDMAEAIGIRATIAIAATFALAAALAGLAGLLLSERYFVTPVDGATFMLKAYIAATIGGWGRIWGAVVGALLLGLFEVVVAALVSPMIAEAALYLAVLLVLLMRPTGLFGEALGTRS